MGLKLASFDAIDQLWEGIDVEHHVDADAAHKLTNNTIAMLPKLQILGMYDSGTNLLGALLKLNLGAEVLTRMCPGSTREGYHCHFGKHIDPRGIYQTGLHMIALVRSPLSHLSSWTKAGYGLSSCIKEVDWLNDNDTACHPNQGNPYNNFTYKGPTGVWNAYTRGYQDLLVAEGRTIRIIEYENLVLNTEDVVRDLGEFLGVPIGVVKQMMEPAKNDGQPVGHEKAVKKIRNRTYMKDYPWSNANNIKGVCRNLDRSVMEGHRIKVSTSEERLYMDDCD